MKKTIAVVLALFLVGTAYLVVRATSGKSAATTEARTTRAAAPNARPDRPGTERDSRTFTTTTTHGPGNTNRPAEPADATTATKPVTRPQQEEFENLPTPPPGSVAGRVRFVAVPEGRQVRREIIAEIRIYMFEYARRAGLGAAFAAFG